MDEERISGALQENVLTLLCFSKEFCHIVRNSITPKLFESAVFRDIASHAIDFLDQFKEPIGDHLADSLEGVLKGDDQRKAASYSRVLDNLFLSRDHINTKYVVSQLNHFIRQQTLKGAVVKAVEAIQKNDVDQAEVELQKGLVTQIHTFELGTNLADPSRSLKFLDAVDDGIHTGIEELDRRDVVPRAGEMFLVIAPPKKGKSWALTHIGKYALLQRRNVLHISLEMAEERVAMRYIQSFFAIAKREARVQVPLFRLDEAGRLLTIEHEEIRRPTMKDHGIRKLIESKINREFRRRPPLIIKQFPTGSLTINALNAYLDGLERFHKFIPDILILDYPDLMEIANQDIRVGTGQLYKKLRGLAIERNLALVAASQGNRESSRSKLVTDAMVAEDYSKIATADNVITYNQTDQEKRMGLARLFVSNGRNDEDKFTVLISQSYSTGQFALDSTMMLSDYWQLVDRRGGDEDEEEDD